MLAEIKKQAENTVPSSTLPSIMEDLKAALEGLSRQEKIRLLTILSNRYQYEQYIESTRMLNTIKEKLSRLSSIKDGYGKLLKLSKKVNTFADNDALQSDRASFIVEYERLLTLSLYINERNLHSGDNQDITKLCREIARYYQVALGTYMVHSALLSNYPID